MAIVIDVQTYCANCLDFEADVTKPAKVFSNNGEIILGDTVVACRYAKRCENIKKFLARQEKEI